MAGVQPNQQRPDEPNEFPLTGPFGGIQSEAPSSRIERFGFADAVNVIFRKGAAYTRPALNVTPALDGVIVGVADFYDVNGTRHLLVMTPTSLFTWNAGTQTFNQITGVMTGAANNLFTSTVVSNKLLFCQGVDKVQSWDGIAANFAAVSANAVPAKFLFELNFHLLACNTIEAGNIASQRVRWTAANDPTDWISLNAGQTDLFNDLGPITGGMKLYQSGFIWQQWGITQVVPTGLGLVPFQFIPLGTKAKGSILPYALAGFGEDMAAYVGKNNIYSFDGNQSIPIGDARVDGIPYRIGARKRILSDLQQCNPQTVFAYISTEISGNDYQAYWLFMPELKQAWVYHFDEQSWTRETFGQTPSIAGDFFRQSGIRIIDLIGTIAQQQWTPAGLLGSGPADAMLVGLTNFVPAYIDFTGVSEQDWSITSGQGYFMDFKHKKTVKAVRLVFDDNQANFVASLTLTNNKNASQTQPIGPLGTGSGTSITAVIPFQPAISGTFVSWKLSGVAGQQLSLTEITPIFDVAGEVRAGMID